MMATRQPTDPRQVPPGSILLVIHDFNARSPDELSLAKGDRIELIERDDDFGDGWFLGRHMTNGHTGLFPEVYTTPAPKGTHLSSSNQQRNGQPPNLNGAANNQIPEGSTSANAPDIRNAGAPQPTSISANNARQPSEPIGQRPASATSAQQSTASPLAQTTLRTSLPSAPQKTFSTISQESPVMNETLSVIDEHITDMHTPRQSYLQPRRSAAGDADSVYSTQPAHRLSYINGHETDEEEQHLHTEAEVTGWTPVRVAEYLEDHGVEKAHCEIFQEQEISGEVLLAMEQSAIFIKEFELGSVGRRLKTWQKIKALQDEVRMSAPPTVPRSVSDYSTGGDDTPDDASRMRKPSGSLPRIPGLQEGRSNTMQQPGSIYSPLQTMTSVSSRPESTVRPSAASIRSMNHSRRHSSIDQTASGLSENISASSNRQSHRKQPSLDKTWTMGNTPSAATTTFNSRRISSAHGHSASLGGMNFDGQAGASSQADLDRGYFSGNEVDNRNKRNVLQKKSNASPSHSRVPSTSTDNGRSSVYMNKNRVVSSESIPEPVSPLMSPAASHYFGFSQGTRAVSSPQTQTKTSKFQQTPISPVVTRLEYNDSPSVNAIASSPRSPTLAESDASSLNNATPSPASHSFSFFSKSRGSGLRVASDAITQNEKARIAAPEGINTIKESDIASPTRTGSTTPSTDTRSFDMQKADLQSRGSGGSSTGLAPPPSSGRGRPKTRSKKETSAYTRGLQKKTPAEQMVDCDYSGWMKKRSSNLISSWKPRLFVLRGRRLSYYYSENDTEEKGLIDISSHRVLPAENERITGLHATLTGASASPTSPHTSTTQTSAAADLAAHPPENSTSDQGLFIFKLAPPRQGLSKAVNFTKPTVHYFAVNSRQEGRLWMAALMKATIDYDANGRVTTSYNQKTISLAKARARKERPPALKEENAERQEPAELDAAEKENESQGLGIGGLASSLAESDAVAGAERGGDGQTASRLEGGLASGTTAQSAAQPAT